MGCVDGPSRHGEPASPVPLARKASGAPEKLSASWSFGATVLAMMGESPRSNAPEVIDTQCASTKVW
jgi:hypothetical protein